MMADVRQLKIV